MQVRFTDAMLKAIAQHVSDARTSRGILDVYKSAEIIRLQNISDNVAREDINEKLVYLAGSLYVPLEFTKHAFESEDICYHSREFTDALSENESVH